MGRPRTTQPKYRYHFSGRALTTFDGRDYPGNTEEQPVTVAHVASDDREQIQTRCAHGPNQRRAMEKLCELLTAEHSDQRVRDRRYRATTDGGPSVRHHRES